MVGRVSTPARPSTKSVSDAVAEWRCVRAFENRPVDEDEIRDILRRAARAPSGGNLQPWLVETLSGEPLAALKAFMRERVALSPDGEPMDYDFYPAKLKPHHVQRRIRNGEILYGALGIDRSDATARRAWIHENFQFFGAPFGILLFLERGFGPSQWLDLGIYLQTVLLLLNEAGYGACPQADWALFDRSVCERLAVPAELTLVCGIAVGFADHGKPENRIRTERDDPLTGLEPYRREIRMVAESPTPPPRTPPRKGEEGL
jgi:nitroreductase